MLRMMYTHLSYIFPLADSPSTESTESVMQTLSAGLNRLSSSFPWIAGQVTQEIVAFEKTPVLQTETRPDLSLDAFREAHWSMRLLDPDVYAPRLSAPGQPPKPTDPAPVFMVKATFITGGVVLTFSANHAAMDMTGQVTMIRLLSKACHGQDFTDDELRSTNRSLADGISLFEDKTDDELKAEIHEQMARDAPLDAGIASPQQPPKLAWAYFVADGPSLVALKARAEPTTSFVSTDDALTALLWKIITQARGLDSSTESLLGRAVDVREALGVAKEYPGMFQNMAFSKLKVQQLASLSLGEIASLLRGQLDPGKVDHSMRSIMTLMSRHPAESPILQYLRTSQDVLVTSWAKMDCYSDDFSLGLGTPVRVLRPRLPPIGEGWVNFMPKTKEGSIMFSVCLKETDMANLRADEQFAEFAKVLE